MEMHFHNIEIFFGIVEIAPISTMPKLNVEIEFLNVEIEFLGLASASHIQNSKLINQICLLSDTPSNILLISYSNVVKRFDERFDL